MQIIQIAGLVVITATLIFIALPVKQGADMMRSEARQAQIIAPEGADSIQTAVLAIKHGMTAKELGETIFPYLTTAEGLKLAAQSIGKDVTKLSCCAG